MRNAPLAPPAGPRLPARVVGIALAGAATLVTAVPASAADPIEIHIRDNRFHPDVVQVPEGEKARLLVINDGDEAEEFESFELNREKIIRPGQTVTIFLPPLQSGEYKFFGEFHPETAQGRIVVK